MKIPEGSKVNFRLHGCGSPHIIKTCEANSDIEVHPNAVTMIDGGLYSTDSLHPVGIDCKGEYVIDVYIQDSYYVEGNTFYQSTSDVD